MNPNLDTSQDKWRDYFDSEEYKVIENRMLALVAAVDRLEAAIKRDLEYIKDNEVIEAARKALKIKKRRFSDSECAYLCSPTMARDNPQTTFNIHKKRKTSFG